MNVCGVQENAYQARLVAEGRRALIDAWSARGSAHRAGQPNAFRVDFSHELALRGEPVDVFRIDHASAPLASVWHDDAKRRGLAVEQAGARDAYHVLVRRAEYSRGKLPFAVDASLVRGVVLSLAISALFAVLARMVAYRG